MTPKDNSEQKRVWPKRTPDQRQLFASVDKWLAFLPYLSKTELDKCREVCEWTNWLIEKHSGGELKQRRRLYGLDITPVPFIPRRQMIPLDIDNWKEGEGDMEKIEAKAKQLIGETVYRHEPEDATVRISIAPNRNERHQFLYLDVKNRLDEKDALLIARLVPRITSPTVVFHCVVLWFQHTPELPADAHHAGSYFNTAVFSLPSNADGSGGGPVKLIAQCLCISSLLGGDSMRGMIKTAEGTVQCQELLFPYILPLDLLHFYNFLHEVAVARPLSASAWIHADDRMEDGRLDEILNFFTHTVPGFESAAPRLRVTIRNTTAWPESLPKESAINPREEQLAERLYKFRHYNDETGEKFEIEVRASFGNVEDEGKGEAGLRVSEMVLHFRPDANDK